MLEKIEAISSIEIFNTYFVEVNTKLEILEDGKVISSSKGSYVIAPGDDYSQQDSSVIAVCKAVHTPANIAEYKKRQESLQVLTPAK